MPRRQAYAYLSLIALTSSGLWAQSPCSNHLSVTGTWYGYTSTGQIATVATLTQNGTSWSGSYNDTAITGHPGLVGMLTAGTVGGGAAYDADLTITEGSVLNQGSVNLTLSLDGTTLSGTYMDVNINPGTFAPQMGTFTLVRGPAPVLVPTTVKLNGTVGGMPVDDDTSLALYNCGGAPSGTLTWTATTASTPSGWLTVGSPSSGTLSEDSSAPLLLTATPGSLAASPAGSPYTGTITISSQDTNPQDVAYFAPVTATVQFAVNLKDSITDITGQSPGSAANLESPTTTQVTFGATVTATLNSASSGVFFLELVDQSGNQIATSKIPTAFTAKGTAQTAPLTVQSSIPQGISQLQLLAVVEPNGGAETQLVAATYTVYPQAALEVSSVPSLWGGVALPSLPIQVYFTAGSPDRTGSIVLNATGISLGSPPSLDVSAGTQHAGISVSNPSAPSAGAMIAITATVTSTLPYLDSLSNQALIAVNPQPAISNFRLGEYAPFAPLSNLPSASTPLSFSSTTGQANVKGAVDYSGVFGQAYFSVTAFEGTSQSLVPVAGDPTIILGQSGPTQGTVPFAGTFAMGGGQVTFLGELRNDAGQTITTGPSAADTEATLAITSVLSLDDKNPLNLTVYVYYLWPGQATVTLSYGSTGSSSTCVSNVSASTPTTMMCPLTVDASVQGHQISVLASASGAQVTASASKTYTVPAIVSAKAGQPGGVPPAMWTPHEPAGPVAQSKYSGLGGALNFAISGQAPQDRAAVRPEGSASSGTVATASSLEFVNSSVGFSPAVPNNTTQFVYQYTAADLPDDPGFNPANLELVSYDPASQQLLTYPSVVDTTAQTVTATLPGLPPYLGLAVPISTVVPELNLPVDPQAEPAPAVLALFNAGATPSYTSLNAHGTDGTALAASPTLASIVPGQQTSASFTALGSDTSDNPAWVQASVVSPGTAGVALLNEGPALEALPFTAGAPAVVLSGIQLGTGLSNEFDVVNAAPFSNDVAFTLFNTSGTKVDQFLLTLPAKGSFSGTVEASFLKAAAPLQGYLVVSGSGLLSASALTRSGNALAALPGQPVTLGQNTPTTLYAPHFQVGGSISARLDIVNPTAIAAHLTVLARKDDGSTLDSFPITVAAGAQYWSDVTAAFGLKGNVTGSITVNSDVSGIAGDVTFGDNGSPASFLTSIPFSSAQTSLAIPYVLNTTAQPMTLYAMNAGSAKANVTLTVYGSDGRVTGTSKLTIPVGGRAEPLLSTAVPASAGQIGGAVQLSSDQPLTAVGLIYPKALTDWASIPAVPSQIPQSGSGPTPAINAGGITNAAADKTTLTRGGIATLFGSNFATGSNSYQGTTLPLPLSLGNVYVTVDGIPAPLFFVNATQINFQVPFEIPAGGSANVVVNVNGVPSATETVAIADYAFALFSYFRTSTAYDPIIVHYEDNSFVTPSNPALPGQTLLMYGTGIGKLNNPVSSGVGAPSGAQLAQAADTPTVTLGSAPVTVLFAGLTPGSVGLAQFDITLPSTLPANGGTLPLAINFPGDSSPSVNLYVQGNGH